jgi:hypothetical protein
MYHIYCDLLQFVNRDLNNQNIFPVTFSSLLTPDDDHLVGRNMSPVN